MSRSFYNKVIPLIYTMRTPGDGSQAAFRRACFKNFNGEIILRNRGGQGGRAGPLVTDALRFSFGRQAFSFPLPQVNRIVLVSDLLHNRSEPVIDSDGVIVPSPVRLLASTIETIALPFIKQQNGPFNSLLDITAFWRTKQT
jgi:hypothetical protein